MSPSSFSRQHPPCSRSFDRKLKAPEPTSRWPRRQCWFCRSRCDAGVRIARCFQLDIAPCRAGSPRTTMSVLLNYDDKEGYSAHWESGDRAHQAGATTSTSSSAAGSFPYKQGLVVERAAEHGPTCSTSSRRANRGVSTTSPTVISSAFWAYPSIVRLPDNLIAPDLARRDRNPKAGH